MLRAGWCTFGFAASESGTHPLQAFSKSSTAAATSAGDHPDDVHPAVQYKAFEEIGDDMRQVRQRSTHLFYFGSDFEAISQLFVSGREISHSRCVNPCSCLFPLFPLNDWHNTHF